MKQFCSFSEAIREGARLTPRGPKYVLLASDRGTCAIGAGAIAIGLPTIECAGETFLPFNTTLQTIRQMYPYLWKRAQCPACSSCGSHDYLNTVAELFDVHDWKREQIADWLESEEEKLGFVTLVENAEVPAEEKAHVTACAG